MTRTLASISAALAMVLLLAVGVRADAPATTYYACVNTSSGTLHMVSVGTVCTSHEQLISWNQTGPQGPAGPQGLQGPEGPAGSQGATGLPGAAGVSGYEVVTENVTFTSPNYSYQTHIVYCPRGKVALAGGYNRIVPGIGPNDINNIQIDEFHAVHDAYGDGWVFGVYSGAGLNVTIPLYVTCANTR